MVEMDGCWDAIWDGPTDDPTDGAAEIVFVGERDEMRVGDELGSIVKTLSVRLVGACVADRVLSGFALVVVVMGALAGEMVGGFLEIIMIDPGFVAVGTGVVVVF